MSQPYVGEIRMFGGNFAPVGWEFCNGQLLSISENEVLFQLIGTTYGGDGESTFALPDLRGRAPIHMGQGAGLTSKILAETGGVESVTLTTPQIPAHTHTVGALARCGSGSSASPAGRFWAKDTTEKLYGPPGTPVQMAAGAAKVGFGGGSQPHENMQPYCAVSFIISLFGVFPSPT